MTMSDSQTFDRQDMELFGQIVSANVKNAAATTDAIIAHHEKRGDRGDRLAALLEGFALRQDSKKLERQLLSLIDRAEKPLPGEDEEERW